MELEAGSLAIFPFLSTLILAYMSVAHCYLELGEMETAHHHLQEGSQILSMRVERFYSSVIDVNPAIYLHPRLADDIPLERMAQLMRHRDSTLTEASVFEKLRLSLWETATQSPDTWLKSLPISVWNHEVDGEKKRGPIKSTGYP